MPSSIRGRVGGGLTSPTRRPPASTIPAPSACSLRDARHTAATTWPGRFGNGRRLYGATTWPRRASPIHMPATAGRRRLRTPRCAASCGVVVSRAARPRRAAPIAVVSSPTGGGAGTASVSSYRVRFPELLCEIVGVRDGCGTEQMPKIAAILQFDTRNPNASNLGRFYQRSMSRPNAAPKAATATMPNVYQSARNGIAASGQWKA